MKPQFLKPAALALLLASGTAVAQEQEAPIGMMPRQGMMGQGMMEHGNMDRAMGMRIMMILMDADGDGTLSLEEVQTAHAKIFKVVDADKNGKVTLEEMRMFFSGGSSSTDH